MKCPTPCVCGEIVELDEMHQIEGTLPDGGNLVCSECICSECDGTGDCLECDGNGDCHCCGADCVACDGMGDCKVCRGAGYRVKEEGR